MLWMIAGVGVLLGLGQGSTQDAGAKTPAPAIKLDQKGAVDGCMSEAEAAQAVETLSDARRRGILACVNAQAAAQLNAQLPRRLDSLTTVERVSTSGTMLTYHLRVDKDAAELTGAIIANLEASTRKTVCATPDMRSSIGYGVVYAYVWLDRAGKKIHDVRIDRC